MSAYICASVFIMLTFAAPAYPVNGAQSVHQNTHETRYGTWGCNPGYRERAGVCVEVVIPENAYPTGRPYGLGWACHRGYRAVDGTRCDPVAIPDNAFLQASGYGWQCERGYH